MEKNLTISIGSDHGGLELKNYLKEELTKQGIKIIDCGTYSLDSCHYPIYAFETAKKVQTKEANYGIVVCTSGEGVSICANKVKGIRCGLVYNKEVARLVKEHNNCNMIAFGAKYISKEDALEDVNIFLNTEFGGNRHSIRVNMITDFEKEHLK